MRQAARGQAWAFPPDPGVPDAGALDTGGGDRLIGTVAAARRLDRSGQILYSFQSSHLMTRSGWTHTVGGVAPSERLMTGSERSARIVSTRTGGPW